MGRHHLLAGFTVERIGSGERLVKTASERVEVGACVQDLAFELLRRHEKDRAEHGLHLLDLFLRLLVHQNRKAEIEDLDLECP